MDLLPLLLARVLQVMMGMIHLQFLQFSINHKVYGEIQMEHYFSLIQGIIEFDK